MTKIENLLVSVMEECSEIQKDAAKALRFGLGNSYGLEPTNARSIMLEFYDLITLISMLQLEGALPKLTDEEIDALTINKASKVAFYQNMSRELGLLDKEE